MGFLLVPFVSCQDKPKREKPEETTEMYWGSEIEAEDEILGLGEKWTGDLDGMIERGRIRALVPYNRTSYFINGTKRGGITFEALTLFEEHLNKRLGKRPGSPGYVQVIFMPTTRDQILPALKEGYGDMAAANLVITEARKREFDFSIPTVGNWREIIVSGPAGKSITTFEDLLGDTVSIRRSSSYYEHLQTFNDSLERAGKPIIHVQTVEEHLEDDDILEMVNAGVIPVTISNNFTTMLWEPMLSDIKVHQDLAIKTGGEIGWAIRSGSPKLKEAMDILLKENQQGSLMSNMLHNKYLKNTRYLKDAASPATVERFKKLRGLFRKYGEQYNWDWLLLAAQGYQESKLDQSTKSPAGAVGIMQIKPSTAADPNVGIDNVYDLENNIHAATKYLAFLRRQYFDSPDIDAFNAMLLSLAAYNMGPGRMNQMRKKAESQGLNPNEWFGQVELVAAKEIGRETVQYVSNIYTYYASFRALRRYGQNTGKTID